MKPANDYSENAFDQIKVKGLGAYKNFEEILEQKLRE